MRRHVLECVLEAFLAGASAALFHHELGGELYLLALDTYSVFVGVGIALGSGTDDRVLLDLTLFIIIIGLAADLLVAASEIAVVKVIGVAVYLNCAVCDLSVDVILRVVNIRGDQAALIVHTAEGVGVEVACLSGGIGKLGALNGVGKSAPAAFGSFSVKAVEIHSVDRVPLYKISFFSLCNAADRGRRHEGVGKALPVVCADEISVAVKTADGIGEGVVILQLSVDKVGIGRIAETLPAVILIVIEYAVLRRALAGVPVKNDRIKAVLRRGDLRH